MSLSNPDQRRALRSIVQAIVALAVIGLVYWALHHLRNEPAYLFGIARWSLGIVALGTVFYGMENVTRAFEFAFDKSGLKVRAGQEAAAAAHEVADAASAKADDIAAGADGEKP